MQRACQLAGTRLWGLAGGGRLPSHQAQHEQLAGPAPQVLLRGRVHSVRGKGKSFFLVLRQQICTIQARRDVPGRRCCKHAPHLACPAVLGPARAAVCPPLRWRALPGVPSHVSMVPQASGGAQTLGFVNNETVSKGMVKYASDLPRESVVDVTGKVWVPKEPITGCTQQQVRLRPLPSCRPPCGCPCWHIFGDTRKGNHPGGG